MDEVELLPDLKRRLRQYFNGCRTIKRDMYYQVGYIPTAEVCVRVVGAGPKKNVHFSVHALRSAYIATV